jgi:hypothetical protein
MEKNKEKEFDAVKMMREIRDKIHSETKEMTFVRIPPTNHILLKPTF